MPHFVARELELSEVEGRTHLGWPAGVYTMTGLEEPAVSGALSSLEALGVIFVLPVLLCLHLSQFSESHFCRDSGCTEGSSKILLFQPCQCTLLPKCIFLYILMFVLL